MFDPLIWPKRIGICIIFVFVFMFFVLIHDYILCFTGSPCCNFSYYNYISIWYRDVIVVTKSIWRQYIVIHWWLTGCMCNYVYKVGCHNVIKFSCHDIILYSFSLPKEWNTQLHSCIRSCTVVYYLGMQLQGWSVNSVLCRSRNQCNCIWFSATAYHVVVTAYFIDVSAPTP